MATIAGKISGGDRVPDVLSGTARAHAIDRWIYVFMAAWFIIIVLVGFIPDAMMKVAMVKAGARPPFPLILHVHAVLMGSFLLLLLAQTWLVATGRKAVHMQLGVLGMVLAGALVVAGFVLAPTMYYQVWGGATFGPPAVRAALAPVLPMVENILLLQMAAGFMFALFITVALVARARDAGLHKRMVILATAAPLGAAIDRMSWLPSTMPANPVATNLYVLLAIAPMFVWDVIRNKRVHPAYLLWFPVFLAVSAAVDLLWDKPWWHAAAKAIMGV
jgi:hypothetical protein